MNEFYTKLYSSITTSSIWRENKEVKILWITMLAMADKFGDVSASLPGLAAIANLTILECQTALEKLIAPDPFSRSQEYEGRRIEAVEGGWHILNYNKYRERRDPDKRREQNRQAQQRFRNKQRKPKVSQDNTESATVSPKSAHQDKDKEQDKDKRKEVASTVSPSQPPPPKISFSFESREFQNIQPSDVGLWASAFPAVDIPLAIKQAAAWLIANPTKRKSNYSRFLTTWFSKEQERGGNKRPVNEGYASPHPKSRDEIIKAVEDVKL